MDKLKNGQNVKSQKALNLELRTLRALIYLKLLIFEIS